MGKDIDNVPLDKFPGLDELKRKYAGKTFVWVWELSDSSNKYLSTPMELDLFRLAAGVLFESSQSESKEIRRKQFREAIRECFKLGDLNQNRDLNTVLLSYCCTYDGPKKLVNDKQFPEIGIIVHQRVDKDEDLLILMVPKDLFYKDYEVMLKEGKSVENLLNDGYPQLN